MNDRKVSWNEFEAEALLAADRNEARPALFRGQRNYNWKLETTLERYGRPDYKIRRYHQDVLSAARIIETVFGKKWHLAEEPTEDINPVMPPAEYPFMAYLRHHGFPSPLLDWTTSPYVAAFFAFHHANQEEAEFVSIFEYREGRSKGSSSDEAAICSLGPWIATDKKHFLQQSEYTVCRKWASTRGIYASHEEAFARGSGDQDMLKKYVIPVSEKDRVLRRLKLMNITCYSLFESTEGLMETLATKLLKN
jgi:FRG domain